MSCTCACGSVIPAAGWTNMSSMPFDSIFRRLALAWCGWVDGWGCTAGVSGDAGEGKGEGAGEGESEGEGGARAGSWAVAVECEGGLGAVGVRLGKGRGSLRAAAQ